MKEFKFRLKADVSYLEAQFKGGAAELAKFVSQVDKAEKKLEIFQEANVYLSQMDDMLSKVKNKYPDLFAKIFDGVDKQVKTALEPFKQMPEIIGQALDKVGLQMQDVITGKNKDATLSEVKSWAKSIKNVADALDIKVDFSFLDESKSSKAKVEDLVSVLKQLREAYRTTSDAAEKANIAPIAPKVKQKKGSSKKIKEPQKVLESEIANISSLKNNTKDIVEQNEKKSDSYNELIKSVERYIEISERNEELVNKPSKNRTAAENKELESIGDELVEIEERFEKLKEGSSNVLYDLLDGDIDKDNAIKKLVDMFGIEIPNAATNAGQSIENTINNAGQSIDDATLKLKTLEEELKKIKDVEAGAFFDSKTGKLSSISSGDENSVKSKLSDFENAAKNGYDTRVHTHLSDIAAPSIGSEQNDFIAWIQVFDYIKKQTIKANKEILSFDFSSLTKETLQEIANKYKELATPIIEDFANPTFAKVKEWGGYGNMDNEMQRQLREVLEVVMRDYPGIMTSFPIGDNAISDSQQLVSVITNISDVSDNASVAIKNLGEEIDEALAQETGDIESKLERLRDIADEFGRDINQKKRNSLESLIDKDNEGTLTNSQEERLSDLQDEIDDADAALEEFGETYDKIILKLDNSKKVEILPNDKGLRDLYKFMDEGYGETFNGVDVADIEFIRKAASATDSATNNANELRNALEGAGNETRDLKAEAEAAKKTFEMLTTELNNDLFAGRYDEFSLGKSQAELDEMRNKLQELADKGYIAADAMDAINDAYQETSGKISASYEGIRNENMYKEEAGSYDEGYLAAEKRYEQNHLDDIRANNELRETIEALEKELREAQQRATTTGGQIGTAFGEESGAVKSNIQAEIDQLERLEKKIFEVKHAVEQKIQAFVNERKAVDSNVGAEIAKLEELRAKLETISNLASSIKIINVVGDASALGTGGPKPLEGKPLVGEQIGMDLDKASQDAKELAAAEKEIEIATKQTNQALDEQVAKTADLSKQRGTLNFLYKQAKESEAVLSSSWTDEEREGYEQLIAQINEYKKSKNKLTNEEINSIREAINGYKIQAEAIRKVNEEEQAAKVFSKEDLLKQTGSLGYLEKTAKESGTALSSKWTEAEKEQYEILMFKIAEYKKSKEKLTDSELESIRKVVEGYKTQAESIKRAKEEADKAKNAFGLKELNKATGSKNNLEAIGKTFGGSDVVITGLENMRNAYERLVEAQKKFNDGHNPTDEERIAYQNLTNQYNDAAKALDKLFSASKKMSENKRWEQSITQEDLGGNIEDTMRRIVESTEKGRVKFEQFNAETGTLDYSVRRIDGTWDHFTAQVDEAGMAIVGLGGKVKTTNGLFRELASGALNQFKNAMKRFTGFDIFYKFVAQVRQGIQYVKEIDLAMTELKKVTNETEETYVKFLQTASKTSSVIGSTVADFTNATADFARLGYSISEAAQLAEAASIYKNVGD